MSKILLYSCVFFNEKYINLLELLLKTYILNGKPTSEIDYLVLTNPLFEEKISAVFNKYNVKGHVWCLNLTTMFEATYARLKIFDFKDISNYSKILYLDTDILISNNIKNILNFDLENKLYVLKEGNTSHEDWGKNLFRDNNPNIDAFTSGIMLFNNCSVIKKEFIIILKHIEEDKDNKVNIPSTYEQPYIIYHFIKDNLYNNSKLINIAINNPKKLNNETVCHFPEKVGLYESKIDKMSNFFNTYMFL